MLYTEELNIPSRQLDIINGFLSAQSEDEYQGEDNTITYSARFSDGHVMDIKCCGCDDDASWTEAVLFAPAANGYGLREINFSEPEDEYTGLWELEDGGICYRVRVVAMQDTSLPTGTFKETHKEEK